MGQMSGAGGSGKRALVNTLKQFIGEGARHRSSQNRKLADSRASRRGTTAGWRAMKAEERELQLLIDKYVAILNGVARSSRLRGPASRAVEATRPSPDELPRRNAVQLRLPYHRTSGGSSSSFSVNVRRIHVVQQIGAGSSKRSKREQTLVDHAW